jgi:hypothetical protein
VYFRDVSDRKLGELRLRETLEERDAALERVQLLSGLLPICAACKKIRDDEGNWHQVESYISQHSQAKFSHGMCPACGKQYYGELWPTQVKGGHAETGCGFPPSEIKPGTQEVRVLRRPAQVSLKMA